MAVYPAVPMIFERHNTLHGGVSSGADDHGLSGGQSFGQVQQPIAVDPRHAGISAIMGLTDTEAGQDNAVTGLEIGVFGVDNDAGEINAGNHRETPDDRCLTGQSQAILIVQPRILDLDYDITRHQVVLAQLLAFDSLAGIGLGYQKGRESVSHGATPAMMNASC